MQQYKWQGETVRVVFGYSEVQKNERALWWSNYECNLQRDEVAIIPSVRVYYRDQNFVLANHFGIAVHKLLNGGYPNIQHFSLSEAQFTSTDKSAYNITKFDKAKFNDREQRRRKWQQKNFPIEYRAMQDLIDKIKK